MGTGARIRAFAIALSLVIAGQVPLSPSAAQDATARAFEITPQPLPSAFLTFAEQSGLEVLFDARIAQGKESPGVQGTYTPEEALRRLLAGTGLTYRFTGADTVTLQRATAGDGPKRLSPLTVTASRAPRSQSAIPGAITVIDAEELDRQRTATPDIQRILQQSVPGFLGPTGTRQSGGLALRGRPALVLQNGVPQNQQLRTAGFDFNNIDPRTIERIEVVRGANATFGFGGTGGLINIITKRPESEDPLFTFEVGTSFQTSNVELEGLTREAFASVEGKADSFDYLLSGSFRDLEDVTDADGDRTRDLSTQYNSNVYNLNLSTGWIIDTERSLRLIANYFHDQDDDDKVTSTGGIAGVRKADTIPVAEGIPFLPEGKAADPQKSTNVRLTYKDEDILGSAIEVQGFWQQWERHRVIDGRVFGSVLDFGDELSVDRRLGVRVNVDSPLTVGLLPDETRIVWGSDFLNLFNSELTESRINGQEVGSRPDITQNSIAGFAQLELPLGDFLISTGVRHERFFVVFENGVFGDGSTFTGGDIDYSATLGNVGLIYYLNDTVEVFGGWSQGFDVTQAGRAAAGVNTVENIELEPAVTDQFEVGVRAFADTWDASLTAFFTDSELASRTTTSNVGIALPLRQPEQIWGVEATFNVQPAEKWVTGGTLHFQRGLRELEDGDIRALQGIFIQPWRVTGYVEFDPYAWFNHRLQFVFSPGHDRFPGSTTFGEGEVSDLFLLDYFMSVDTRFGQFRLGVENLLNEQYVTQYREATNSNSQFFAAPGRTVRLTYRVQF